MCAWVLERDVQGLMVMALEKRKPLHCISRVDSKELGWEGLTVLSLFLALLRFALHFH